MHKQAVQKSLLNSSRVVKIIVSLNAKSAEQYRQEIGGFTQQSSRPIIVVINSGGGKIEAFYKLEKLFNPDNAVAKPQRFVTVANSASSAAAYLLIAGHYAYVFKKTQLHLHGVRTCDHANSEVLAMENALKIALHLDQENRNVAEKLAARVASRLAFRYQSLKKRKSWEGYPGGIKNIFKTFSKAIHNRLTSNRSKKILAESLERFDLIFSIACFYSSKKLNTDKEAFALLEAKFLNMAMAHNFKANRLNGQNFNATVAAELMVDYLLASNLVCGNYRAQVHKLAESIGKDLLDDNERQRYQLLKRDDETRAANYLQHRSWDYSLGLWCFAFTVCHRLLIGRHTISANDAFWLGLVDGVFD